MDTSQLRPDNTFKYRTYTIIISILLLSIISYFRIQQPIMTDEWVLIRWIEQLIQTGKPSGIHSPGYTLISAAIILMSDLIGIELTHKLYRVNSHILILLSVLATYFLLASLPQPKSQSDELSIASVVITLSIVIIHPLMSATANLLDMEALFVFLVPLMLGIFIYTYNREMRKILKLLTTSLIIATLLWVKFGVLPAFAVAIVSLLVVEEDYRAIPRYILSIAVGVFIFIISWWLYSIYVGIPFIEPFLTDSGMVSQALNSPDKWLKSMAWVLLKEILWISPAFILSITFMYIGTYMTPNSKISWPSEYYMLLIFCSVTVIQYAFLLKIPSGFPKYMSRTIPLVAVIAGYTFSNVINQDQYQKFKTIYVSVAVISMLPILLGVVGDPFLKLTFLPSRSWYTTSVYILTNISDVLIHSVALSLVGLFLLKRINPKAENITLAGVILLLVFAGTSAGIVIVQTNAEYSTHYQYGVTGVEQTGNHLLNISSSCEISAERSIAWNPNYPFTSITEPTLPSKVSTKHTDVYAIYSERINEISYLESHGYQSRDRIGSFIILSDTQTPDCV